MSANNSRGKPQQEPGKKAAEDRLAKALRDNLHRRKAQARARKNTAGKVVMPDHKALES